MIKDVLFRNAPVNAPFYLEVFFDMLSENEFHLYLHAATLSDVVDVLSCQIAQTTCYLYRLPYAVLNPHYWERHSQEAQREVMEKTGGVIIRNTDDGPFVFRADRVALGRLLRDDVAVPDAQLVKGDILKLSGEAFVRLAQNLSDEREGVAWTAFACPPTSDLSETAVRAQRDIEALQISFPDEIMVYSTGDNTSAQLVFSRRELLNKVLASALRGFVYKLTAAHVSYMNERVINQIYDFFLGAGFTCLPDRDFFNKGRSFEMTLRINNTRWNARFGSASNSLPQPFHGDESFLLYYDRTSGIWALSP